MKSGRDARRRRLLVFLLWRIVRFADPVGLEAWPECVGLCLQQEEFSQTALRKGNLRRNRTVPGAGSIVDLVERLVHPLAHLCSSMIYASNRVVAEPNGRPNLGDLECSSLSDWHKSELFLDRPCGPSFDVHPKGTLFASWFHISNYRAEDIENLLVITIPT